ncbi:MAG: Gfo/Idh/MocA family oxidoreductase [Planctomycetota bacterium]
MAQTPIKTVAVWGCGGRGRLLTAAALALEGKRFVAAADAFEDAAQRFVTHADHPEFHGVPAYTDPLEMLTTHRPDLVILATRPVDREAPIRACVEAGVKAVLAEKPLATSWGEARRICELITGSGMRLAIGHQRRYLDMFTEARRVVQEGLIGKITLIDARAENLFDWGTHLLDAVGFVTAGLPVRHALGQFQRGSLVPVFDQPTEQAGVFHYSLEGDGPCGLPVVLRTQHGVFGDALLRIVGDAGVVEATVTPDSGIRVMRDGGPGTWESLPVDPETHNASTARAVADFVASVEAGEPCRIDLDEAMRATEMIFAGLLSAVRGDRVSLPLEPLELPLGDLMQGHAGSVSMTESPVTRGA